MSDTWATFPYPSDDFDYAGDQLEQHWDRLHRGDREPFPSVAVVEALAQTNNVLGSRDPAEVAAQLQAAWRAFHRGDFGQAVGLGESLGVIGSYAANKAQGIHAVYLEEDEAAQLEMFQQVAARAEAAQAALPGHANSWYFHAFALGRYSQGISVAKALAQGLGGKIRASLDRALKLEPLHADAHTALGLYHAEVIDKVGKMVGKLTYGASRDAALEHFREAVALFPESAIARMEYANGLLMLDGDRAYDEASELYVAASEAEAADAMERLDVELARSQLE